MAMRGMAEPKNHNSACICMELSPHNIFSGPGHILKSTKGIAMELGLKIDGSMRKGSAHYP